MSFITLMELRRTIVIALALSIHACIGTDYVDDPTIDPRIEAAVRTVGLMPGETYLASADYYDMYGVKIDLPFTWTSTDPAVAEVDENGLIRALRIGQTAIQAHARGVASPEILVSVQTDPNAVAFIDITSPSADLVKGDKLQLQYTLRNFSGETLTGAPPEWFTDSPSVLSVSANGEV